MITARTPPLSLPGEEARWRRQSSTMGIRKASVLPEPVPVPVATMVLRPPSGSPLGGGRGAWEYDPSAVPCWEDGEGRAASRRAASAWWACSASKLQAAVRIRGSSTPLRGTACGAAAGSPRGRPGPARRASWQARRLFAKQPIAQDEGRSRWYPLRCLTIGGSDVRQRLTPSESRLLCMIIGPHKMIWVISRH